MGVFAHALTHYNPQGFPEVGNTSSGLCPLRATLSFQCWNHNCSPPLQLQVCEGQKRQGAAVNQLPTHYQLSIP